LWQIGISNLDSKAIADLLHKKGLKASGGNDMKRSLSTCFAQPASLFLPAGGNSGARASAAQPIAPAQAFVGAQSSDPTESAQTQVLQPKALLRRHIPFWLNWRQFA
jgi:hypothetical protein